MTLNLYSVIIVTYLIYQIAAKNLTRCDLAIELLRQGFPEEHIQTWVCIVEAESSRRTNVIGGPDDDGSYDYGLFQINDRYWCSTSGRPGKGCNVLCKDLITEDITNASACAMKIYKQQGYPAWLGWKNECDGRALPSLDECKYIRI